MTELLLVLVTTAIGGALLSRHLVAVFDEGRFRADALHRRVEAPLYRLLGVAPRVPMDWRGYFGALLLFNLLLGALAWLVFMTQAWLPLNPDRVPNLSWDLALHTAVSFMTNTNQQHYSGQAQLSHLSQTFAIVTLQFVTPASGMAVAVAMLRGLRGGFQWVGAPAPQPGRLGHFHVDLVRSLTRVFLPLALLLSLVLVWQGVPATYAPATQVTTLEAAAPQAIPLGPVAPMVAIKQLGTNGGGWYGPNSATPLENPTPLSNALQTMAILLLPVARAFAAGPLLRRPRVTALIVGVMVLTSAGLVALGVLAELQPNAAVVAYADGPNMEGKEQRFGAVASALWGTLTTQTSNGSVNAMHDSFNPLGGMTALVGMFVNAVWGGVGVGLIGFVVYLLVTVFLAGLMVGRTPELFGRKLDLPTIQGLAVLVVLPPAVILVLSAITLWHPALAGTSNPGFHGIAQVVYEYASAFANNGSGFEGLGDNTPWWNLSCVLALLLGRYVPIAIPLYIAGRLSAQRAAPETAASLRIDTPLFAATLIGVIALLTLLTFLPALMLGPIGEALALAAAR